MNDFFKIRKWFYLLLIVAGFALFRLPIDIDPISAYLIPAILGVIFDLMQYNSNSTKALEPKNTRRKTLTINHPFFNKVAKVIYKLFVICVIGIIILWVVYELYNFYLWLEISI